MHKTLFLFVGHMKNGKLKNSFLNRMAELGKLQEDITKP